MKLHILSDLHTEFADFDPPEADADLVVLAGDIGVGPGGLNWAARRFPDRPVIYVPGNHEFYGHTLDPFDYELFATRVICNPRGYPGERFRNGFVPDFTVVV